MLTKHIKATLPFFKFMSNLSLVLGTILLLAFAVFMIRMSFGPMNLDFAKNYIESALSDTEEGYKIEINTLSLTWPKVIGAMLLDLRGVEIIQEEATQISVGHVALGLSGLHILVGKIRPSVVIVDGPAFQLVQKNGRYNFLSPKQDEEEVKDIAQEAEQDQDDVIEPAELSEELPVLSISEEISTEVIETSSINPVDEIKKQVRAFLEQLENPKSPVFLIFSDLKRFEVRNAIIIDEKNADNPYLALINLSVKNHALGLYGDLRVTLPSVIKDGVETQGKDKNEKAEEPAEFKFDIIYRWIPKNLTFIADVKNINPSRFSKFFPEQPLLEKQSFYINGVIKADLNSDLNLEYLTSTFKIPEGELVLPELYDAPLVLKDAIFVAKFDQAKKQLEVSDLSVTIGGIPVQVKTTILIEDNSLSLPLEINIPNASMSKVAALVPKSERKSSGGEWLFTNLKKGHLHDIKIKTDLKIIRKLDTVDEEQKLNMTAENTKVDFRVEGLTVQYSDTLMPITGVIGAGVYEDDVLTITAEIGKIGAITGRNVTVKLSDLSVVGGGVADVTVDASGPLSAVLKYAAAEPIAVSDELGFDIKDVKGKIEFNLKLNFPTVKDLLKEDVNVKITGVLSDVLIPNVVEGLPLTGGPYELKFSDGAIQLSGSGKLAERPITLDWMQYLDSTGRDFETKVTAKITTDEGLRKSFGIGLTDYISGPLPVDVIYIEKNGKSTIDVKGDLAPTSLHIDSFDYRKLPDVQGTLSLKAYLNNGVLEEVDQLSLKTDGFSLSGGRLLFKKMRNGENDVYRGSIGVVTLGKTNTAIDFEVTPKDELKIIAKGSVVDIAPFIKIDQKPKIWNNPTKEESQPMIISIFADRLLADKGEVIREAQIYLETNKNNDITRIEMDAKIGKGEMYLRFKPEQDTGKRTFRLESSDAGRTLKAFGLYDDMRGGKIVIYGQPHSGDKKGDLFGKAQISKFSIKHAPALAKLFGTMSMKGVNELLKNDGLVFSKLSSDFEWRFRDDGNLLVLENGRTSGSSLGLTFDGVINQGKNKTDISGTIIPLSGVNKALGDIPIIGDILTGGKALFAATYKIKGPSEDPTVTVNPLSVLAPGFLRKILFEESVNNKLPAGEAKILKGSKK